MAGFRRPGALAVVGLVLAPGVATAQTFNIGVGTGLNICMPSGEATCDDISPSFLLALSPELRFLDREVLGLSLDVVYGRLSPDQVPSGVDVTLSTWAVMPTLRGYLHLDRDVTSLFGGIGLGYGSMGVSGTDGVRSLEFTVSNPTNFRLTAGVRHRVGKAVEIGGSVDHYFNSAGTACVRVDQAEECESGPAVRNSDIANLLQFVVFVRAALAD